MVPAADIGERHLQAHIALDQLGDLLQGLPKSPARIIGAGGRGVRYESSTLSILPVLYQPSTKKSE
jgi:hypothetical protein